MKCCKTCNKEQSEDHFYKYKEGKLHPSCKECTKEKARQYYKTYYPKNSKSVIERTKEYAKNNKQKMRSWHASYARIKRKTDPQARWGNKLRKQVHMCIAESKKIRRYKKPKEIIPQLGCTTEFLVQHIQNQFIDGMNWDNYGSKEGCWEIDHIIPLSYFDLENESERQKANNYTNIRPLWVEQNRKKRNHLE